MTKEPTMPGVCAICGTPVDRDTVDAHMDAEHPPDPFYVPIPVDDWWLNAAPPKVEREETG